jgi:hypothetical protein
MAHEPHWTPKQRIIANQMKDSGSNYSEIGEALGKSKATIRNYFRMLSVSPEDRAALRAAKRSKQPEYTAKGPGGGRDVVYVPPVAKNVPACVLEERERALSAPMSLSAQLCGDPPPGRSALDKMSLRRSPEITLASHV